MKYNTEHPDFKAFVHKTRLDLARVAPGIYALYFEKLSDELFLDTLEACKKNRRFAFTDPAGNIIAQWDLGHPTQDR